jgi:hypothetical protein
MLCKNQEYIFEKAVIVLNNLYLDFSMDNQKICLEELTNKYINTKKDLKCV